VRLRDELLEAIAREQALITRLEREREQALARVRSLQVELDVPVGDPDQTASRSPGTYPSLTAAEKIALFRSLFRGRGEVFPKLWVNPPSGRKGYAPACANEWVRGVCEKPRVKCGECPNQAFIPVSDQVVLDHLQGRHVIGVYPLLEDDIPGRRLRRRILGRRRRRVRRDLPHRRVSRRCRTLTIGKRRACLVLFRRARGGRDCAPDGLLPHHRNDEAPPPARDDILRPALPEPGHVAPGRVRQPDRPAPFAINPKSETARRPFEHRLICRESAFRATSLSPGAGIQELYAAIAADARRNELILNDVIGALEQGRSPILLTERKDHLEYFAARLQGFTRHLVVLQGGMTAKARREAMAQLAAIRGDEERLMLATGRYIGEGFDDARLDTLFLAMPVSWKGTLVQYTGRLHRLSPGKTEVRIYDYVDPAVPMLARMFEKRLRGYRAIGYAREETPLVPAKYQEEPTVEYDEDAFSDLDGAL